MPTRSALVVGNARYSDDKLSKLNCPHVDVTAVQEVLRDPQFGAFDSVVALTDGTKSAVERAVRTLFNGKSHDDLVLLYFSGHGLRDDEGELYLATSDTEFDEQELTSISASFVKRVMDKSNSRRQVIILDCCYGGAFSSGFKGTEIGATAGTKGAFGGDGYGRMILTASDAMQYAWEGDTLSGELSQSRYTQFLLEGIKTGEADANFDGMVSLSELHEYVTQRTKQESIKQRPTYSGDRMKGAQITLSKAPERMAILPDELTKNLRSSFVAFRKAAISELVDLYGNGSRGIALSALQAMVSLRDDDSNAIRLATISAIENCKSKRADISAGVFTSFLGVDVQKVQRTKQEGLTSLPAAGQLTQENREQLASVAEELQAQQERMLVQVSPIAEQIEEEQKQVKASEAARQADEARRRAKARRMRHAERARKAAEAIKQGRAEKARVAEAENTKQQAAMEATELYKAEDQHRSKEWEGTHPEVIVPSASGREEPIELAEVGRQSTRDEENKDAAQMGETLTLAKTNFILCSKCSMVVATRQCLNCHKSFCSYCVNTATARASFNRSRQNAESGKGLLYSFFDSVFHTFLGVCPGCDGVRLCDIESKQI